MPIFKILNKIAKFFYEEPPQKPIFDEVDLPPTGIMGHMYQEETPKRFVLYDFKTGRTEIVDNYLLDPYQDNPCDEPEPLNPRYSD